MSARHRQQRSQAMTEFALVAPVLLLLTFGIIDFGRALYFYAAAGNAAREAAHAATRYGVPYNGTNNCTPNGTTTTLPTNTSVTCTASVHFPGATIAVPSCPNGPIPSSVPSPGQAWVFTTEPGAAGGGAIEATPSPNAAGGDASSPSGACSAVNPAAGQQVLQVTVVYNFVPVTPLVSSVIGNHVVFTLQVLARTEY
jgi:Flp pilus assembly protein TadG